MLGLWAGSWRISGCLQGEYAVAVRQINADELSEPILRSHKIITAVQKKTPQNILLDCITVLGLLGRRIPAAVPRRQTLSSDS